MKSPARVCNYQDAKLSCYRLLLYYYIDKEYIIKSKNLYGIQKVKQESRKKAEIKQKRYLPKMVFIFLTICVVSIF